MKWMKGRAEMFVCNTKKNTVSLTLLHNQRRHAAIFFYPELGAFCTHSLRGHSTQAASYKYSKIKDIYTMFRN